MAGKVIEYKFTDWLGMSFDDSYEREEPQYKYITIDAPEDAKFAFKFREVLGDHRGYSTAFYWSSLNRKSLGLTGISGKANESLYGGWNSS